MKQLDENQKRLNGDQIVLIVWGFVLCFVSFVVGSSLLSGCYINGMWKAEAAKHGKVKQFDAFHWRMEDVEPHVEEDEK